MEDKKAGVLDALSQKPEMFTLEVARSAGISPATACKYLEVLRAEGKVASRRLTPFTYWRRTPSS